MTSAANQSTREIGARDRRGILRIVAVFAAGLGAVGSVLLLLYMGRRNKSIVLMILFSGWVLAPFVGTLLASAVAKSWPAVTRTTLHTVMIVLALASLMIYGLSVLRPPAAQPAFVFVLFPVVSSLFALVVVVGVAFVSRYLHGRGTA